MEYISLKRKKYIDEKRNCFHGEHKENSFLKSILDRLCMINA